MIEILIILSSIVVVAIADNKFDGDWFYSFGIQLLYVFSLTSLYYILF
jgi:hypothetical protein